MKHPEAVLFTNLLAFTEESFLPALPTVAYKLISISSKEEIGMKEIADIISKDASLSAKVLKIANSALQASL